ncbi:MAG TPA: hypothetical protein VMW15_13230 [Terracidiphilus sp.]|nr:hypothetical protein [Terracidiphilus sp.]
MPVRDIELTLTPPAHLYQDARDFLRFLRVAAQKHAVTLTITSSKNGTFKASIPAKDSEGLDAFLQEITFQHGLYYYLCGTANRRDVARSIVKPVIENLLVSLYDVAYPVQIKKHLLQGSPDWAGGEFLDETAQGYEILYQKRKLKMVSGYEFIRDLDDLLTEFMLSKLGHSKGQKSPKFNVLVERCSQQNVLRTKEVRKLFNRVHSLRTKGLHRLEREIPEAEITEVAQEAYYTFQWIDDYRRAQREKTAMLSGKKYRRIRYGKEPMPPDAPDDFKAVCAELRTRPCHDCGVVQGELHLDGCDVECCPRCGGQYMCCHCRIEQDELESADR